jgi:hypothetical protein
LHSQRGVGQALFQKHLDAIQILSNSFAFFEYTLPITAQFAKTKSTKPMMSGRRASVRFHERSSAISRLSSARTQWRHQS